jgi:hypothetical protein
MIGEGRGREKGELQKKIDFRNLHHRRESEGNGELVGVERRGEEWGGRKWERSSRVLRGGYQ